MSYKVRSNYKRLGDYIQVVNERNRELEVETLLGVSIQKVLMPSIANTIGTNMTTYKIIKRNQFAYGPVTSRNGDKISIALLEEYDEAIVSQMYTVFEVIDKTKLNPEYLMMWFRRPEFDRFARFKSHGSTREVFNWEEMCEVELPIPSIEKQNEIVKEYNTIVNRIELNETLNQKLEETAQALYKHWFSKYDDNVESINVGDLFTPRRGKNITRAKAIYGDYPVVAGGLEPSCYHNNFNTKKPVVTISASGANAGFVNLYHTEVWAGDCSFIDNTIFDYVYFAYIILKVNQSLLMSKQEGTGQPHIYPQHIITIPVHGFTKEKMELFNKYCEEIFNRVHIAEKEIVKLIETQVILLSKMTKLK